MLFNELNRSIPKGNKGKRHSNVFDLDAGEGWSVRIKYPGKYGPDDYVVQVKSDGVWDEYRSFTHGDFFMDVDDKAHVDPGFMAREWLPHALKVVQGLTDPHDGPEPPVLPGIALEALTVGTQALAVCEYRRYSRGDSFGGGRYLPINFTAAILHGHWTASEAWASMQRGLPALKELDGFQPFRHTNHVDTYLENLAAI